MSTEHQNYESNPLLTKCDIETPVWPGALINSSQRVHKTREQSQSKSSLRTLNHRDSSCYPVDRDRLLRQLTCPALRHAPLIWVRCGIGMHFGSRSARRRDHPARTTIEDGGPSDLVPDSLVACIRGIYAHIETPVPSYARWAMWRSQMKGQRQAPQKSASISIGKPKPGHYCRPCRVLSTLVRHESGNGICMIYKPGKLGLHSSGIDLFNGMQRQ